MKTLTSLLFVLAFSSLAIGQDWTTQIEVKGNLPTNTNWDTFFSELDVAINANLDNATHDRPSQLVNVAGVWMEELNLTIKGIKKPDKDLEIFAEQITTYFEARYGSARLTVSYQTTISW